MTPSRKWLLGGVGAAVLIFVLGYVFVVMPARSTASDLADQVAYQQDANVKAAAKLDLLRRQSGEVPSKQAEIASVRAQMPETVQQPELVRMIEDAAANAGVQLQVVTPSTPTNLENSSVQIVALPMSIQATGGYANIKSFVDNLEKLERAFLITALEVHQAQGATTGTGDLSTTITGRFFSLPKSSLAGGGGSSSTGDGTSATSQAPTAGASAQVHKHAAKHQARQRQRKSH
jgi:Tfp pilus assembly protein PilO